MSGKSFRDLSRRERLYRFRKLAKIALGAYGFSAASLALIQYNENVIYRVDLPGDYLKGARKNNNSTTRYLLRLHAWDEMDYINGEMLWLDALSHEAGLAVPEPIRTLDENFVYKAVSDRPPSCSRWVTLLSWLDGRKLIKSMQPKHLKSLGKIMAKMHNFSVSWKPPEGFSRPTWDWDAQLGGSLFSVSRKALIDSMPEHFQEPFKIISKQAKAAMKKLGEGSDAFGLIHADLYPENILFREGQAYPIDFEDCGFSYWIWDIAVALCTWAWDENWPDMRDAFYKGYSFVRTLPDDQWELLDLFIATQSATMLLWASAFLQHDPKRTDEYMPWRDDSGNQMMKYFKR